MKTSRLCSSSVLLCVLIACGKPSEAALEAAAADGPAAAVRGPDVTGTERPVAASSAAAVTDKLACTNACVTVSTAPPSGCCTCTGSSRTWQRSSWSATTWLCK